jgi:hypothetical protein
MASTSGNTTAWDGVVRTYYPRGISKEDFIAARRYLFGPPKLEDVVPKNIVFVAEIVEEHVAIFKGPPVTVVYTNKTLFQTANIAHGNIIINMDDQMNIVDKIETFTAAWIGKERVSIKRVKSILTAGIYFEETKKSLVASRILRELTGNTFKDFVCNSGFNKYAVKKEYQDVLDKVYKDYCDECIPPGTVLDPLLGEEGGMRVCAVCGKKTPNKCARCKKAYVCSEECLKMFWPSHKVSCMKM